MNTKKTILSVLILIIAVLLIAIGYLFATKNDQLPSVVDEDPNLDRKSTLVLFVQDKEAAATSDCRVTKKITKEVPFTITPIDTSLRVLFEDELSSYGKYQQVVVSNGLARVYLESALTPDGYPISSLSSCQVGHLFAVIQSTLTQYDSVNRVELYTTEGKIEF
jgi:hypothetical protein